MHYYQFNIGDYRKDTQHLSPMEHYIYRELIDWLYLDERPIKPDLDFIVRRLRLTNDRSTDVQQVLNEYFTDEGEGYIQARVSQDIVEYHKNIKVKSKAGKASGKARRSKAIEQVFDSVEQKRDSVELTINHKPLTINQIKKTRVRFTPPTIAQVQEFCKTKNLDLDPLAFVNFYQSKDWMVGKNKMKDWKAAAIGWASRNKSNGKAESDPLRGCV